MTLDFATVGLETNDGFNISINTNSDDELVLTLIVPQTIIESDGGMDTHFITMDFSVACEFMKGVGIAVERLVDRRQAEAQRQANPTPAFEAQHEPAPFPEEPDPDPLSDVATGIMKAADFPMRRDQAGDNAFPEEPDYTTTPNPGPAIVVHGTIPVLGEETAP